MLSFYDWRNNPSDSRNPKHGRPRRGQGRGLKLESLEQRCLLSFLDITSVSSSPGPLTYVESGTTSTSPNELSIVSTGANGTYTIVDQQQTITLSSTAMLLGWTGSGTNTVTGPVSSVTSIAISSSNEQVNNLTIESIDAPTTITGFQSVALGRSTTGGTSSLAGIRQSVAVGVQTGQTTPTSLTLDDSGGTVGQNWTLAPTSVTGASPGAISWTAGQIDRLDVLGGQANDVFAVNGTGAATNLDPGAGSDSVTISATSHALTIASQPLTGGFDFDTVSLTAGPSVAGALSFTGSGGMTGLSIGTGTTASTFAPTLRLGRLTGVTPQPILFDSGALGSLSYTGAAGPDTLTVDFSAGNPIPAFNGLTYDGGAGFNTLVLQGGSFTDQTYRAFGSTDGMITLDSSVIRFDNLSPIIDTVPAVNFNFVGPDNLVAVNVVVGPVSQGFQTTEINSGDTPVGFELVDFANKTNVTVDLTGVEPFLPPGQVVTLNTPVAATGLATLTVLSGISNDQINVVATAPGVATAIESGTGNDQIAVRAAGLGAGSSISIDGGTGVDTLTIDAGGAAVSFTENSVSVAGAPPITLTNIEQVNIINAANPPLTPIPVTITGVVGQEIDEFVGRFTNSAGNEPTGNFNATIDWGDGSQPTTGIVSGPSSSGPYGVSGNHTYSNSGTFPVTVQVLNLPATTTTVLGGVTFAVSDLGGSITIDSTANIAARGVTATPVPITVVEDQTFTKTLATFTASNVSVEQPSNVYTVLAVGAAQFTATIDWGDGTAPSAGTISQNSDGVYVVDGTHLYLRESAPGHPYLVTITIVDQTDFATVVTTTATVLSNDVVTTTADSGPGSLRAVIDDVNADQIPTTIRFNIPGAGSHRIAPNTPLPAILFPVDVDGTSQPGFLGNPLIELSGLLAGPGANGLTLTGGDSTVRSLVINQFGGIGLLFEGAGGNRVVGNRIGTDVTGTQAAGNGNGLQFQNSGNNIVGGVTPAERNIISGNHSIGLSLAGSGTLSNRVFGNYIGTDVTGQAAVPNFQGVVLLGAANNFIGGASPGMGNVISGNASAGLQIFNDATVFNGQPLFNPPGSASGNAIQGNLIGTNAQGTGRLGNAQGIFINDASGNLIGGTEPGAGNVIAGNRSIGIQILGDNATGNSVLGNFIGTNRAGDPGLGNSIGVFLYSQPGNIVAPESTPGGNVIRFNTSGKVETRELSEGPQVERVGLLKSATGATIGFGMTFTTYLDNQRALNPANYIVSTIGRNFRPGPRVRIASVTYDDINRLVTVIFASPIPRNTSFRLKVVGTAPNGLTDRDGNFLDGNPEVVRLSTGSDFETSFIQGVQVQTQTQTKALAKRTLRRPRGLAVRGFGGPRLGGGRPRPR